MSPMPKQERATIRMDASVRSQMAAIQALESASDEQLEAEKKYRAHAQLVLGTRAAERMDSKKAREHFQRALTLARPQERQQFRRVADHALAVAERRADDVKVAAERLGVDAPSKGQLRRLKLVGLIAPPKQAGLLARLRGIALVVVLVAAVLGVAFGIVSLISLIFGGLALDLRIFWSLALVVVAFIVLAVWARRKQKAMRAQQAAARGG